MLNYISKRSLSSGRYMRSAVQNITEMPVTFYRRDLPPNLISFTSPHGKHLFRESLEDGHAENYFSLVGNFTTQSEPAFCAPGSLAMVLNALEIDPGKRWKGAWRWYSDDNLECSSVSSHMIRQKGVTFREFTCLAKCNGLKVQAKRADTINLEEFEADLKRVCTSNDLHMVVSFSRKTLGQTGDGHFSPIGALNVRHRKALVLDTARFKYPSYFASVDLLYESMKPIDKETGLPRGYFLLSRNERRRIYNPLSLCKLTRSISVSNPRLANLFCKQIPSEILRSNPSCLSQAFSVVLSAVPAEYSALINVSDQVVDLAAPRVTEEQVARRHDQDLASLLCEISTLPIFNLVHNSLDFRASSPAYQRLHQVVELSPAQIDASLATIFILASPKEVYKTLKGDLLQQLDKYRDVSTCSDLLRNEIARLSDQLNSLMNDYCACIQQRLNKDECLSVMK